MIVFHEHSSATMPQKIVAVFGIGLIGTAVCSSISSSSSYNASTLPFNWGNPARAEADAETIFGFISNTLTPLYKEELAVSQIAFVWCAGKGGFDASEKEVQDELVSFEIVLRLVGRILAQHSACRASFHLVSSAGGLFEDQRLVGNTSEPKPLRYYGHLKLQQEQILLNSSSSLIKRIYRPTSVYGYIGSGARMGLIPLLISNGLKNRVSTIFGGLSTLRDYVLADNIGGFIQANLFNAADSQEAATCFLASGKPSSIFEIKLGVEKVIGKKIYVKFHTSSEMENTADITIESSALQSDWTPIDIYSGIRLIKERIISESYVGIK